MIIYNYDNTELIEIIPDDKSYNFCEIMGESALTLYFKYSGYVEIPIGSYVVFQSKKYTLLQPQNFKKNGTRNFEYTLTLEGAASVLKKYLFRDTTSRKIKFSLTAKPEMHVQMIVDNLNNRANESGWSLGEVVNDTEIVLSYSMNTLLEALNSIASECDTEWEVTADKVINLKKVEYNKDNPLSLSYGKGNGFRTGIKRESDIERALEVLYVQGGEKNINAALYGSKTLLLPKSQSYEYEGRTYITDENGYYIKRSDKILSTYEEGALDCSDIYPSRVGTISGVIINDVSKNFYDFIDNSIPEALNYKECLINGETMTVIFQSGILTGKEFEVKYIHNSRKFEIVPTEIDGVTMPNETFIPAVGDTYSVFGINLPDAYVCDNDSQKGASWSMFKAGCKYLYENETPKFTFSGEIDSIWLRKNWKKIGKKFKIGGYIHFTDEQFESGVNIRIKNIKQYVNNPYNIEIELSNMITGTSFGTTIGKIKQNEVTTEIKNKETIQYTNRRFRNLKETSNLLQKAFNYYGSAINPVSIATMQMIVGDKSLQFRFVDDKTTPARVAHNVTFSDRKLTSSAGIIQHMTLGISSLSSKHSVEEYKFWTIPNYTSPSLEKEKAYYLYAKCSKSEEIGKFLLSKTNIGLEDVDGYYHLLVGILNSKNEDGERSYVNLYGFTELLPGQITTEKIISGDGNSYFDMVNSALKLKDKLQYNVDGKGELKLRGTIVQSQSGDESMVGCFRGKYSSSYTYYEGDQVTYNGSTWQYIYSSPSNRHTPKNDIYWVCVAAKGERGFQGLQGNKGDKGTTGAKGDRGAKGDTGATGADANYYEYRYAKNGSTTSAPSLSTTSTSPSGWSTKMPTVSSLQYLWMTFTKKNAEGSLLQNWSTPVRVTPRDGAKGDKGDRGAIGAKGAKGDKGDRGARGDAGPSVVYRGTYTSSSTYYGNSKRVDVVKYSSKYYVARIDAGTFKGTVPTSTSKWNSFGAQYESVATNLLLANNANIADWIIKSGKITSQGYISGVPRAQFDGLNGKITLASTVQKYTSTGGYDNIKQTIKIDSRTGNIEARTKNGVAYINSLGIFANQAGIQAIPYSSGIELKAAIAGLGFGNLKKSAYDSSGSICGVYGYANNSASSPAPAYGGYFFNLFAAGLILNSKIISGSSSHTIYLPSSVTYVLSIARGGVQTVYLPSSPYPGQIILLKQQAGGSRIRMKPYPGQTMYDDNSANTYYDAKEGQMIIVVCAKISSKNYWIINRIKY